MKNLIKKLIEKYKQAKIERQKFIEDFNAHPEKYDTVIGADGLMHSPEGEVWNIHDNDGGNGIG